MPSASLLPDDGRMTTDVGVGRAGFGQPADPDGRLLARSLFPAVFDTGSKRQQDLLDLLLG